MKMSDITWFDTDGAPSTTWAAGQTDGLLRAGSHTDYFVDPRSIDAPISNAPLLLTDPGPGAFQFTAVLRVHNRSAFDAIALFVYDSPRSWGKFAIERAPDGQDLLTTVITRGASDDANGPAVDTRHDVWLRISRIRRAYAFHDSLDEGRTWSLRRLFTLGDAIHHRVGFAVQSPTGDGLTATVVSSTLAAVELKDVRDGS
jgi:regulation of enolase protein 1 (concanavalin A-like superfamily)